MASAHGTEIVPKPDRTLLLTDRPLTLGRARPTIVLRSVGPTLRPADSPRTVLRLPEACPCLPRTRLVRGFRPATGIPSCLSRPNTAVAPTSQRSEVLSAADAGSSPHAVRPRFPNT